MNWVGFMIGMPVGALISYGSSALGRRSGRRQVARRGRVPYVMDPVPGLTRAIVEAQQRGYDYCVRDLGEDEARRIYGERATTESVLREHLEAQLDAQILPSLRGGR